MGSKLLVFALITSVVVSGALNMINSAFAQTPVWYPGEGVKQGMYVKYRIEDYDTNERQPYVLTLYFQQQDQDGNWIVPAYVEANGRVLQGTLKLSQGMSPLAGGEVPQEMSPFIGGYQNSLLWLDAASSIFEPLSLTAGSWGKIASIGGQEVKPAGSEQVQFAGAQSLCGAPSCDATRISWRKGVDSNVWVVNEFPFPVKAQTYADVTTPPQPIQYAFELLETGSGQPPAPTATGEAPRPPLDRTTTDGSHVILTWNPVDIQPNSAVNFGVEFRDANNAPLNGVSYDFLAKDANGPIIQQLSDQYAQTGISSQQVTFNSPGPKTILITINAVGSRPTGQLIESTDFNIVVAGTNSTTGGAAGGTNATTAGTNSTTGGAAGGTNATIPEFSTVAIVVLAIAIIGIIIATSRQGRFSFSQRM
jgi:predicted secreted protein with PEFG-CTERM motif